MSEATFWNSELKTVLGLLIIQILDNFKGWLELVAQWTKCKLRNRTLEDRAGNIHDISPASQFTSDVFLI